MPPGVVSVLLALTKWSCCVLPAAVLLPPVNWAALFFIRLRQRHPCDRLCVRPFTVKSREVPYPHVAVCTRDQIRARCFRQPLAARYPARLGGWSALEKINDIVIAPSRLVSIYKMPCVNEIYRRLPLYQITHLFYLPSLLRDNITASLHNPRYIRKSHMALALRMVGYRRNSPQPQRPN